MVSQRAHRTTSFIAMDVLERANERDDVVHLEVGEPDFEPPEAVFDTAVDSLRSHNTTYTTARGKEALRLAIAAHYDREYGVSVDPDRIFVTPGSSPGLLLSFAATVDPGETVLLTDPGYACYPNFVRTVDGRVRTVPLSADRGFQPRLGDFREAMDDDVAALLLNSPANPTGAVLDGQTLRDLAGLAATHDAMVVSDEIYHGLSYDTAEHTVLEYTDEAFVLNGFSKRFGMTGWRLGWVVVPPSHVEAFNRLAQNVLICAPNFLQDAGVTALETDAELDAVRASYRDRRDRLLEAVERWGLDLGYTPEGAYYLLADVSEFSGDSVDFANRLLDEAGVAVTPGIDFGDRAATYVRLSYATDADRIEAAIDRIDEFLETRD
ncbi:MAG: pyridoxal phosphate-dependent aminotransferase [Natronomonas sp.]